MIILVVEAVEDEDEDDFVDDKGCDDIDDDDDDNDDDLTILVSQILSNAEIASLALVTSTRQWRGIGLRRIVVCPLLILFSSLYLLS